MELQGASGGQQIGVACMDNENQKPGDGAGITLTVDDLSKTKADFVAKGVEFVGEVMEVPNEVKLALFKDFDGNKFQLVQNL